MIESIKKLLFAEGTNPVLKVIAWIFIIWFGTGAVSLGLLALAYIGPFLIMFFGAFFGVRFLMYLASNAVSDE